MLTVAAFYRFFPVADPAALRGEMLEIFQGTPLKGTMLIAPEGVNGTMAGPPEVIERLVEVLGEKAGLPRAEIKFAEADEVPFRRLKFKVKREIITFRGASVDPTHPGTYVEPQDWNRLIDDPEVVVLDTRNTYESEMGTFARAVKPEIENFSELVGYVREQMKDDKHRKVAMFCTGGIRCEKASAFLLEEGFGEVYHLKGGILRYLEEMPEGDSRWQGGCYVFDERRSVDHSSYGTDETTSKT